MAARFATALLLATLAGMSAAEAEMLPGSEWEPVTLGAEAFEPQAEIFLRFEADGRYVGSGGCNRFQGSFVTNGEAILFGPAAATRMFCPEPVSGEEAAFLAALDAARIFLRDGTRLSLADAQGTELLGLRQRDAD